MRKIATLGLAVGCAGGASGALAQDPGPVALAQHTEAPATILPEAPPDQLVTGVAAGGTLNTGNTKAVAANAGGQLLWRDSPHQLSVEALATLSYADDPAVEGTKYKRNSANAIGRARYDLFLSREDALFVAISPRRDVNAGLDLRLQNQIGYLRNVFHPNDDHRVWLEAGYDLTYDNFAETTSTNTLPLSAADQTAVDMLLGSTGGDTVSVTQTVTSEPDPDLVHSARVFLGYTNHLSPMASLNFGADVLFDVQDSENVRVNGVVDFTSSLNARFKLGLQFRALFDNVPVPTKGKLDTISALQLIYTYDSLAEQASAAPAAAAPCDCSAEVKAAQEGCAKASEAPAAPPVDAAGVVPSAEVPVSEPAAPATEPAPQ